jgi:signal transduction histidine kinase
MERVSSEMGINKVDLIKLLNFLPYPFLLAQERENTYQNIFVNNKFLEEIGYSCEEMPTIDEWFHKAYPQSAYRNHIIAEWKKREEQSKLARYDSIVMQAKIHTKYDGERWYEVKSSTSGPVSFVAFVNIDKEIRNEIHLKKLNENKDRTLSILSHDLRSPLANLYSVLQLANSGNLSESEQKETFTNLSAQVFQMIEFLDTTLQWTKINFSNLYLVNQVIDTKKIISSIMALYQMHVVDKKITIDLRIDESQAMKGDPDIFSIVIRNIISNAIKFTPVSGAILISNERRNGTHSFSIENTGVGISSEKALEILNQNYGSEKGTRGEKGLGLGLKLCQHLLGTIGGKLSIESPGPDKTRFTVAIPQ